MKITFCNKDHFIALARDAERRGFNRQVVVDRCIDDMDDNGTNIMWFSMLHEHIAGVRVDPHIRTIWFVKMKNSMRPVELALDMTMQNFEGLPRTEVEEKDEPAKSE